MVSHSFLFLLVPHLVRLVVNYTMVEHGYRTGYYSSVSEDARVGPRHAIALDDIRTQSREAKALRDYNAAVSAMANVQSDIKDILDTAAADASFETKKTKLVQLVQRLVHREAWRCQCLFGAFTRTKIAVRVVIRTYPSTAHGEQRTSGCSGSCSGCCCGRRCSCSRSTQWLHHYLVGLRRPLLFQPECKSRYWELHFVQLQYRHHGIRLLLLCRLWTCRVHQRCYP